MTDFGGFYIASVEGIYSSIYTGETEVEVEENDQDGANYSYIAEQEGTLTITIKGASMYNAETETWEEVPAAALTMVIARGSIVFVVNGTTVTEATTTATLEVGKSVTIQIVSPTGQALKVNLDVTYAAPAAGDEGGSEGGMTGSGKEDDPYIVGAADLPIEIPVAGEHDLYYKFTATEAMVITVSYTSGNYVSITGGYWEKDSANCIYTVTLKAGETITINPWGSKAGTYVIAAATPTTPDQGGEGGEGGEEGGDTPVAGETLSWVGANGSGRAMKVTINKAAGTMSIIRAALAGNSLDTATGATEAIYTYSFDGTTVTYTCVSGQSCTVTFDAEGNPVSVVWGTATYTGFVLEA